MTKDDALRLALDALESLIKYDSHGMAYAEQDGNGLEAIATIREALAQPEQEPVAWMSEGGSVSRSRKYLEEMGFKCSPLYAAPPHRKPEQAVTSNCPKCGHKVACTNPSGVVWRCPLCTTEWPSRSEK